MTMRKNLTHKTKTESPAITQILTLHDGRHLLLEIPAGLTRRDRSGEIGLTIEGVKYLDRARAMTIPTDDVITPGFLHALREAIGITQSQMGEKLGVAKLTVSRWERGDIRPSSSSLAAIRRLREQALRRGVVLEN